jgi:hypothetical protein
MQKVTVPQEARHWAFSEIWLEMAGRLRNNVAEAASDHQTMFYLLFEMYNENPG